MHRVLVLGAGMVAKPLIDYLLANNCKVTVACNTCENARRMIKDHRLGTVVYWDAGNSCELRQMAEEADIVVSLLPYKFHYGVAEVCIEKGRHMVTTSYVREEMAGLDEAAKKAGIIILNEIGLDPGIDHMSAMKIIDNVHEAGGTVEKFWSICGALPAPPYADNPLAYKFTWSPEGVLLASLNDARYLDKGETVIISPEELFRKTFDYKVKDVGVLEVYANRDSISYIDIYGLKDIKTIFRGTFRFRGWCETIDAMKTLDLLNKREEDLSGKTYAELLRSRTGKGSENIKRDVADHLGKEIDSAAIRSFEWLGLFDDKKMPPMVKSSFDVISDLMVSKMILKEEEQDMIVLRHVFLARKKDGSREVISSQMIDYGSPATDTSIARTVALPAAVATKLILDGKINLTGVYRPVEKEIYLPVLKELEEIGIRTEEEYQLPESELIF